MEVCGAAAGCREVVRRRSEGREGGRLGRNGVEFSVEMEVKEEEEEMKSRTKGDPVTHTREQQPTAAGNSNGPKGFLGGGREPSRA